MRGFSFGESTIATFKVYRPDGVYVSYHRSLSAAHLKALTEAYKKNLDGYQVRWDDGVPHVGIVNRSFQSAPNSNGDVVVPDPGGTQTLFWNTLNMPSLAGKFTGTPTSLNVRQFLFGTLAATAPITIVSDTGATGWSMVGDNLTHAGDAVGSGSFHLHAVLSGVTADSPVISWSYVVQTAAAYDWAPADGLDNGTGAGNWVMSNGATTNADPTADGYLQINYANDWSGISSHHAQPTFVQGFEYEVTVNIDAGGTRDRVWVQLGVGTAVVFSGTGAITHNVVCGSGTPNIVLSANGEAATGLNTRIVAISANPVADVFSLTSSTHSVQVSAGTLEVGVTRAAPSTSAATLTITRTTGTDGVAQLVDSSYSWAASEGGTKFATLQLNGVGSVTLTISSPSVGSLGAITQTVVTVIAQVTAGNFPRLGMLWIGTSDLGGHETQYQTAQGIENMRRRHVVIMARWPELQSQTGVSMQTIVAAVKSASTIGTRIFNYSDQDGYYKASYTSNYATKRAKMIAEGWELYAIGENGATVDSYFGSHITTVNNTSFSPVDSSGMRPMEWFTKNEWGWMALGQDGNSVAPGLDGLYIDNIINSPRVTGDWNRDGSADSVASPYAPPWNVTPKTWYRAGIAAGITAFRATYPTVPVIGNIEFVNLSSASDAPEYDRLMDGGSLEGIMGDPDSSYESFLPTTTLVARIQLAEDMIRDPILGIVTGYPFDGQQTNYQEHRHFMTFVLVTTNMCIGWEREQGWGNWDWYDEYDFNLGQATESRRTSAESNSIWRRDFDNGIALWCPRGVTGTISLGGTFYVLRGNAAGFLTAGASVTSVTFSSERNGLILSRTPT